MRLIDADEIKRYMLDGLKLAMEAGIYTRDSIEQAKVVTDGFIKDIDEQPTVEAEPVKHGHWTNVFLHDGEITLCKCSVCGVEITIDSPNYCPKCGAKMDEVEDEADR